MTDNQKLTPAEAEGLREQLRKARAPAAPGVFRHLTDEQMTEHLADVNAGIERGEIPF